MEECVHIYTDKVNFGYDISTRSTEDFTLHCHNFYEVYFFLEGNIDYLVEGQKYTPTPQSLLLLPPHAFHGARINDPRAYRRFSLHFHPDILSMERRAFLLSVFPSPEKFCRQAIYFEHTKKDGLISYFEALKNCASQSGAIQAMLLPVCIEALLARILSMQTPADYDAKDLKPNTIQDIITFLNQNLCGDITLDMLSQRFFISKHHLNKVFRKATGTTVMNYLLYKRIITAQQLLISGHSAQEAALRTGFSDYSSFYRSYVHILGHAPVKDRGIIPSLASLNHERFHAVDFQRKDY